MTFEVNIDSKRSNCDCSRKGMLASALDGATWAKSGIVKRAYRVRQMLAHAAVHALGLTDANAGGAASFLGCAHRFSSCVPLSAALVSACFEADTFLNNQLCV
ncbi:Endoribonuclease YbeY [Candidatus Hodgkinia cicadicola]|nr:Endoribonuclease YbeY [Candidatus Hodgkinia cicadicola]